MSINLSVNLSINLCLDRSSLLKKVFFKILQYSQENTCASAATLLKKRLWHKCFPVNFAKFLRTPFLTKHLWWLLLKIAKGGMKWLNGCYRVTVEVVPCKKQF